LALGGAPQLRLPTQSMRFCDEPGVTSFTLALRGADCQRLMDGLRHAALKGLRPEKKPGLIRCSPQLNRGPFVENWPQLTA
jgi:hypothetical protein